MSADLVPPGIADERAKAFGALMDRLEAIDRLVLLTYHVDSVPAPGLFALAWQFDVLGAAGWALATTDNERRDLVRDAIARHRLKGTAWAVEESFRRVGFLDAHVTDPAVINRHNGEHLRNSEIRRDGGAHWAEFDMLLDVGDEAPALGIPSVEILEALLDEWKPARSHVKRLSIRPALSDAVTSDSLQIDVLGPSDATWDGEFAFDGSLSFGGLVVLSSEVLA